MVLQGNLRCSDTFIVGDVGIETSDVKGHQQARRVNRINVPDALEERGCVFQEGFTQGGYFFEKVIHELGNPFGGAAITRNDGSAWWREFPLVDFW